MLRTLESTPLMDGRQLSLTTVECPEPTMADELSLFYAHKGEHWLWHIEESLSRSLDRLETRFYMARSDSELAAGIVTTEYAGAGVLTHVFTEPAWRRLGVCTALLAALQRDFAARGGKFLTLGTGYETTAYRVYERAGFRSVAASSGTMLWEARPGAHPSHFQQQECKPAELAWHHWPGLCALIATDGRGPRTKRSATRAHAWFEQEFLLAMERVALGELAGRVLEGRQGEVLGFALLGPRWPGARECLLETWVYPGFWGQARDLLASFGKMPRPTVTYADGEAARTDLLSSLGFRERGRLPRRWGEGGEASLIVMST